MDPIERRARLEEVARRLEGLRAEATALDAGVLEVLLDKAIEETQIVLGDGADEPPAEWPD